MENKKLAKVLSASALLLLPEIAFAAAATNGVGIINNIIAVIGAGGYLVIAIMAIVGLWCLYVFGTNIMKMGKEDQREEVKPKSLIASLAGALCLTYGTYIMYVGMNTAFGGDVSSSGSAWSTPSNGSSSSNNGNGS